MICHRKQEIESVCFINNLPATDRIRLIELGFSHPKPCTVGPRIRRHTLMHFILEGKGSFNGKPIEAGQGFLVHADSVHSFTVGSAPWSHCWVAFEGENALLQQIGLQQDRIFSFRTDPSLLQRLELLAAPENEEQVNECVLLSVFYQMLSLIEGGGQSPQIKRGSYVDATLSLIHSRFNESLRITELARRLNLSEGYLWRIFRREIGCSPLQYLEQVRLDEAKRLLRETALSATEIAVATGYPSAAAFFRQFKKNIGLTPLEYRKNKSTESS